MPLYKKVDPLLMDNYRPISLLTSISKVFEKVVFNQIYEYFSTNNLFYAGQYGFREDHPTELANTELAKLADWFKANRLTLNISKTKYKYFKLEP